MTYREAVKDFRQLNGKLYEDQVDYWTAQAAWAGYTDTLCKDGWITQKQYDTWKTPFRYGKRLSVERRYSR